MRWTWVLTAWGLAMALVAASLAFAPARAQEATPTAGQLQFGNVSPSPQPGAVEVEETVTRTPTPPGPAYAEAIDEANVRSGPGIDYDRLGTIYNGDRYVVIGAHRDYPWYQIEFPDSPTGTAWIYRDLVTLSGNVQNVPIIEGAEVPTQDPAQVSARQTIAVLEQTPGALGTATALAALLPTGVFAPGGAGDTTRTPRPPTFTPPPLVPTQPPVALAPGRGQGESGAGGLPPAVPIIGLAAIGILGLIVSVARRLI